MCLEGIRRAFYAPCLVIEEAQIVVHEGHQPDLLGDLFDADRLAGKGMTQVDLSPTQADAPAARHCDSARADTDCNHIAGPRVFHLLSAIVLAAKRRLGAEHVLVAWVNHSAALIFTLTYEIHNVARPL